MALLAMFKDRCELTVCHVNYHHRPTALRDEKLVRKYCQENGIKCHVFNYKDRAGGNFQDKARVFRYAAFKECVLKDKLDGVLVGHHKDDLIETYFLQTQRKSNVTYWGLKESTEIMDVKIYRPLLSYTKDDLLKYCLKNAIPYGIDESNLTNDYKRNLIRHTKIEKMSLKEKNEIIREIKDKNKAERILNREVKSFIGNSDHFDYEEFMSFKYLKKLIRTLTFNDLSDRHLDEIIKALKAKGNIELKIHNKFIFKEYGYIEVKDVPEDYSFTVKALEYKKYPCFTTSKKGDRFEGVTIKEDDYPLTIRNVRPHDFIKMRYGTKGINRFFIDHKISGYKRKIWPVLVNRKSEIILVPGIGCNIDHYSKKHNLYLKVR